jgi:hypothetical protein
LTELRDTSQSPAVRHELYTRDISSQGAFFLTSNPFPEGSYLRLKLFLYIQALQDLLDDDSEVGVDISGRVIRTENEGMAVLFDPGYEISTLS